MNEDDATIEEKRRKNIMDNQKFLESLKLFNVEEIDFELEWEKQFLSQVRDDFKSTVSSVKTKDKPIRKPYSRKEPVDP